MNIVNKITGRNIVTEYLGLMSGLITNDEFEEITCTYIRNWELLRSTQERYDQTRIKDCIPANGLQ